MKTIAITGGSGFVGKHLLDSLMHHHDIILHVLVRDMNCFDFSNLERTKVFVGDLTNEDSLYSFVAQGSIVINLAYIPSNNLKQNLIAIKNLISVCKQRNVIRLIHCSTAAVAGRNKDRIITEKTKCVPFNQYERTKLEIENTLLKEVDGKFELVIVRPTAIYGPGVQNLMKLASEITSGNRFVTYLRSSLFNRRKMNLVSIENVTHAIQHLAFSKTESCGEIYYVSDDDQSKNNFRDVELLLRKFIGVSDYSIPIVPLPKFLLSISLNLLGRSNIDPLRIYSSEKLKSTGYKNKINIEEGIALFSKWYNHKAINRKPVNR